MTMKIHLRLLTLVLTLALGAAARAEELRITACCYVADYAGRTEFKMGSPEPQLRELEQMLMNHFRGAYGSKVPEFPLLTLGEEANARAGSFGIALNRAWLDSIAEPMAAAVLAHVLGHLCQAYGLLPINEDCKLYGIEGEADYFAGRLLAASGMNEQTFEAAVAPVLSRLPASATHPPGNIRVMLTRSGFYYDR